VYFYIFDPDKDKEQKYFERIQGKLLNLLAELHIEGETYRVTAIRTIDLLVEQAIGANAKTLIIVGSDRSLNKAINAVVTKKTDITVGFISLDPGSALGQILGIPAEIEESVKILAGRLVRELNLGKVAEHYFLSQIDLGENSFSRIETPGLFGLGMMRLFLKMAPFALKISLEDSYTATSEVLGAQIINCRSNVGCHLKLGDPTDKLLDVLFLHKLKFSQIFRYRKELASGCLENVPGTTVMHAKKIEILGPKKLPLSIAGQIITKAPAVVTIAREKVKMIVGKGRQF
jgi:diacylglycerol kinase (ATP)